MLSNANASYNQTNLERVQRNPLESMTWREIVQLSLHLVIFSAKGIHEHGFSKLKAGRPKKPFVVLDNFSIVGIV